MHNSKSTVAQLYPNSFKQDFIGKGRYWMGIPYLPPLEIELVKRTFEKYKKKLSENDKNKNKVVKNYIFNEK